MIKFSFVSSLISSLTVSNFYLIFILGMETHTAKEINPHGRVFINRANRLTVPRQVSLSPVRAAHRTTEGHTITKLAIRVSNGRYPVGPAVASRAARAESDRGARAGRKMPRPRRLPIARTGLASDA